MGRRGGGPEVLRAQLQSLRPSPPHRLLRLEAAASPTYLDLARGRVRSGGILRERLSLPAERGHRNAGCTAPADCAVAARGDRICWGALAADRGTHGLRSLLR